MSDKHPVTPENAPKFLDWIANRGGIAIWRSINLSNPGASWSAPVRDAEGNTNGKPNWQTDSAPERIITDPNDVEVVTEREVKRFRVAVRFASGGMSLKVTDAGSARIRREVAKAAKKYGDAWHTFDYSTQEAVILVADQTLPLSEWKQS